MRASAASLEDPSLRSRASLLHRFSSPSSSSPSVASRSGHTVAVAVAVFLLALGFLGLAHALIDAVAGRRRGIRPGIPPARTLIVALAAGGLVLLLALTAGALALPDSDIARALARGLS